MPSLADRLLREATRSLHQSALDDLLAVALPVILDALRRSLRPALDLAEAHNPAMLAAGDPVTPFPVDALDRIGANWTDEVDKTIKPLLGEMFKTGALAAQVALTHATTPFDVVDLRAEAYLEQATNRLVGIGDTAWTSIRSAIVDQFDQGGSIDDIRSAIQDAVQVAEGRAVTIARTEVVSASNAGSIEGARALGDSAPTFKEWLATADERTREAHAEADGQVVALDDPFDVDGEELDAPGDPAGSPENVINCRCTVVYTDQPPADDIAAP